MGKMRSASLLTNNMGRGAISAAIRVQGHRNVLYRNMQSQWPLITRLETYDGRSAMPLTGTATLTRSSAAAIQNVAAPPPLMPVTADPLGIHVGPADQVVDATHAVPAFHSGRRVATRMPPPTLLAIGAVVEGRNFAELQRVEHQADVPVPGKPDAV